MDFRREAVEKLRCYAAKKESIARSESEIKRLECERDRIRSEVTDSTPVSGGANMREEAMINNIALRSEMEAAIKDTQEWLHIVDDALMSLDADERLILDKMYIHRAKGNIDKLCDQLHVEKPTIYRRKDKAVKNFTLSLYGITET